MKKLIVLLFCIGLGVLLMLQIGKYLEKEKEYSKILIGDDVTKVYQKYGKNTWISSGELSIYLIDDGYLVITADCNKITSVSVLSIDGKWVYLNKLFPITFSYEYNYEKFNFNDIEVMYGKAFVDIGNGVSLPAYITMDGKIIYFQSNAGIMNGVYEWDIITKQINKIEKEDI